MGHRRSMIGRIGRIACLVAAAVSLSGCIVVPARHYHYPGPRYYY